MPGFLGGRRAMARWRRHEVHVIRAVAWRQGAWWAKVVPRARACASCGCQCESCGLSRSVRVMDLGSARMATSARGALANLWAGCCVSGLRVRGVCLYSVLGSFGSGFERFAFGRQHKSRSFREISAAAPMSCAAPMSRAGAKHMAIKLIGKLIVDIEVNLTTHNTTRQIYKKVRCS